MDGWIDAWLVGWIKIDDRRVKRAFGERIEYLVGDAIELRVEVRGQIVEELRERVRMQNVELAK